MSTAPYGIYTRVSTGKQVQGTSLEDQERLCRAKAEAMGLAVGETYVDGGVSGGRYLSRPGIQRALTDIEAGRIAGLVITDISRYSRDRKHQSEIRERVQLAGGRLVFVDDNLDFDEDGELTPDSELMFHVKGDISHYEKSQIRKRTMRGRRARAMQGVQPSRAQSPYGYHIPIRDEVVAGLYPPEQLGRYVVVQDQARWVRAMFEWIDGGASLREVCRRLQANTVPAPRGGEFWLTSVLRGILRKPLYKGEGTWGRTRRRTSEARLSAGYATEAYVTATSPDRWVALDAPAIVDAALWQRVQDRLDNNRALLGGQPKRRFLLSNIARCPICGGGMSGENKPARRYYRCRLAMRAPREGVEKCPDTRHRADDMEAAFVLALRRVAGDASGIEAAIDVFRQAEEERMRATDGAAERAKCEESLAKLARQERAAQEAMLVAVEAGADPAFFRGKLADIARQRRTAESRLAELAQVAPDAINLADVRATAACVAGILDRLPDILLDGRVPVDEKHTALSRIVRSIVPDEAGGFAVDFLMDETVYCSAHPDDDPAYEGAGREGGTARRVPAPPQGDPRAGAAAVRGGVRQPCLTPIPFK